MTATGPPAPAAGPIGPAGPGAPPAGSTAVPRSARPPRRRPWLRTVLLVTGGLLAALLVVTSAVVVAGLLVRTGEEADTTFEGPVERVVVSLHGSITVRPGPDGQARVERRSRFSFTRPDVTQSLADGVLTVRVRCAGLAVACDHRVHLTVPADADLDLRSHHASVHDTRGRVLVRMSGGALHLDGVAGPVDARVGGGAVIGRRLLSDEVRAESGAGAVELDFAEAPTSVDAQAGAGHVAIVLPPGVESYRVDAQSGHGEVQADVRTDDTSERLIRAHAGTGGVTVRYGSG